MPVRLVAGVCSVAAMCALCLAAGASGTRAQALSYAGRDPDAAWRAAAAQRIERHRKADVTVVVTDAQGRPVADARVDVAMRRHAFGFGSAVSAGMLRNASPAGAAYRAKVMELFNRAVPQNDLKCPRWEANRRPGLDAVGWLRENGLDVRGHTLVWPGWAYMPGGKSGDPVATPTGVRARYEAIRRDHGPRGTYASAGEAAATAREWLERRIDEHVLDEVTPLRGRIAEWDVVNEPYTAHSALDVVGRDAIVRWFRLARAADRRAKLFLNDFGMIEGGGTHVSHQRYDYELVRYLLRRGAPLDGIGFQGHFMHALTPPDRVYSLLDRFARLGEALEITEFDFQTADEQLQADYTRDFMTIVFSHPRVTGFVMWGFWEGSHWRPAAAMYRRDWTIKPNGEVYNDLVFREWWTNAGGRTNAAGSYATRGFLGEYEITVAKDGRTVTQPARLRRPGTTVQVVLG